MAISHALHAVLVEQIGRERLALALALGRGPGGRHALAGRGPCGEPFGPRQRHVVQQAPGEVREGPAQLPQQREVETRAKSMNIYGEINEKR